MPVNAEPHRLRFMPALTFEKKVVGPYVLPVIEAAAECGIQRAQLAATAQVDLPDPLPAFFSTAQYLALLQTASTLSGQSAFGLTVGRHVKPATYSLLGITLLSCTHLGQSLEQVLHWEGLVHQLGQSRIEIEGDVGVFSWSGPHEHAALIDSVFAGIINFAHWLSGRRIPLLRVELMHPVRERKVYEQFFQCEIIAPAPRNALLCETAIMAWPVVQADPSLLASLQDMASRLLLTRERETGLLRSTRTLISDAFPHQLKLEEAATALHMSPRTLQRRLQGLDTHFQQELEWVRRTTAEDYLRYSHRPLTEIAFLLGYQEQSSFTHAFKGWSGMNPGEYRRKYRVSS